MREVIIFLMHLVLAKKAENLSTGFENEAMELGYKVENHSLAVLVRVCGKALHINLSDATCKLMTSIYALRWLIRLVSHHILLYEDI